MKSLTALHMVSKFRETDTGEPEYDGPVPDSFCLYLRRSVIEPAYVLKFLCLAPDCNPDQVAG
jgi:hypothetical protein